MRRITLWLVSTISALVLLFSYRTSTMGPQTAVAQAPSSPSAAAPAQGSSSSASSSSASSSSVSGTFTGDSVDTRWGPVQVKVTVTDGRITDVTAVDHPSGNPRDAEINAVALPQLHDEVISAQSAQIDTISGATVTSDGYISSLQSALDAAHLGS